MQEIAIILSSLAGVATAAIVRRIPKEKNQAGKTTVNTHVKNQITSLKVERDILNKIITRLYKDSPDITNAQKDKLLAKYQYQLKIVTEKLDRLEQAREHPDFNLVSNSLAALMDKKLSKLDGRLDEISAKMQEASKQELPKIKQPDITKTVENSSEKTQELKDGISEKSKISIGQKEPTLTKESVPQSKNIETKVGTAVTAAPVLPKVDNQTEVGKAVTAAAASVTAAPTASVTAVAAPAASVTAVVAPVLPKVDSQTEVGTLPETASTKKSALAISESVQTGKILPIEEEIDGKVPIQSTEDKIQIMQAMVQKPENQLEKTRTSIAMPKPVAVIDPDKTDTSSKLSLEENPVTTDVEFDDGDGDIQDLDEIKKDIVKIMTKLDQAEVE